MPAAPERSWVLFRPLDLLVAGIILAGAGLALPMLLAPAGNRAEVYVENRKSARLDLEGQPRRLTLATPLGPMELEYGEGRVRIVKAACVNKLCVKAGPVSRSGASLICLPSRVRVEVEGGARDGDPERPDAVTF